MGYILTPCSLLLRGSDFTDSSPWGSSPSVVAGSPAVVSAGMFGSAINCAAGALTYANYAGRFDVSGDFTIEAWIYVTSGISGSAVLCHTGSDGVQLYGTDSYVLQLETNGGGGSTARVRSSISLTARTWTHVAVSRASGVLRLFIGGALAGSATDTGSYSDSITVGRARSSGGYFYGYIDEFRFWKGEALYTSAFTPPTTELSVGTVSAPSAIVVDPSALTMSNYPVPAPALFAEPASIKSADIYNGGRGAVGGTVKVKASPSNTPVVRRVRLFRDFDGAIVGETWSSAAGAYAFSSLDTAQTYTAISYDHTGSFESVCASGLKATVSA